MKIQWTRQTFKRGIITTLLVLFAIMQTAQAASRYVFIHSDMLGSPMATTDQNGNIISREFVTPYGDSLGKHDSSGVAIGSPEHGSGYTGHVRDSDLDLTYMQARYYDPTIGRFMGADPVSLLGSKDPAHFNRYAYGNNNPYKYVDPDGRNPDLILSLDPAAFMSDVAPAMYGVDTSTKEGTYTVLGMMQKEAAYEIGGYVIFRGLGRIAGKLFPVTKGGFKVGDFVGADAMSSKNYRKLVKGISENGLKNKQVEFVVKDGVPHVTHGSNRLAAAKQLGIANQIKFVEKTVPTRGFQTLGDVVRVPPPKFRGPPVTMK